MLSEFKYGYLEKCTNVKCWNEDNKEIKAEIILWCEGPSSEEQTSRRGKSDDSGDSGSSKQSESIDQIYVKSM